MYKKKNGLIHATACTNLTGTILNERSQTQKATHYMIPFICHSGKGKTITKNRFMIPRGNRWGRI